MSVARCSAASPAPRACAVSPAVPMRKKPKLQKMKSKMTAAAAIAPSRCAWPSLPMIAASAMPSNGVDKWASVIGNASRTTRAWLTRGGFTTAFALGNTARPPGSESVAHILEPRAAHYITLHTSSSSRKNRSISDVCVVSGHRATHPSTPDLRAKKRQNFDLLTLPSNHSCPGMYFDERTPSFGICIGKLKKTRIVNKDHLAYWTAPLLAAQTAFQPRRIWNGVDVLPRRFSGFAPYMKRTFGWIKSMYPWPGELPDIAEAARQSYREGLWAPRHFRCRLQDIRPSPDHGKSQRSRQRPGTAPRNCG